MTNMQANLPSGADGEVPALAETDVELWADMLGDYISVWLRNSPHFITEQQKKMYKLALCPFLFGVTLNLPEAWLEILRIYGIIEPGRENRTSPLSEVELQTLDMVETIFKRCSQLVSNKNDLKTILNFIYEVEERSALLGRIDMSNALQEVTCLEVFGSMWAPIKRCYENRKRQAHVCIIYYFKIISYHIIQYGQNGTDRFVFLESILFQLLRPDMLKSLTEEAKDALGDVNYYLTVEQYSTLIEKDPLNINWYGQRAKAYAQLCDYWAALSDCRRNIVLEPCYLDNVFYAADYCLELGLLDKAEEFNQHLQQYPGGWEDQVRIQEQTLRIRAKRRKMKHRQTPASTDNEDREIDYNKLISDGSDHYLSGTYNKAAEQFKAALDILARSTSQELTIEGDDLAVIWLVHGLSCVKTQHIRNAQAAIERFNAVISQTQTLPAAFYGLALAYILLKRYQEAGAVLKTGLARLEEYGEVNVFNLPGTNTVIEETVAPTLKKLMENLLKETMFPPNPDAVCKFHIDTDILKKEMYFSDPDYKGHVQIRCRAKCCIDFHIQCWKSNNGNSRAKHNWKELLDTPCPTPACWGSISEVHICRPDQDKNLKLSSQMEMRPRPNQVRPKLKMKTGSLTKLERKLEMKRMRKERRQVAKQVIDDQQASEQQSEDPSCTIILPPEEDMITININRTGTLLRKDEPEMGIEQKKQKTSKSKKKEKKQKQFLAVDVQFKGDENKERYGINSLDDDGDVVNTAPTFGLLPTPGSESKIVTSQTQPFQQSALEVALYEFFYKLLLTKGSLDLLSEELEEHTKHLSEEAQTYILSYGGLARFLAAHRQFHVSQNKVASAIPTSLLGIPLLVPQVNPSLVAQVNPNPNRQHKPSEADNVNPWTNKQHKPTEADNVNPWTNKQHKPTESDNTRSSQGQLNPGAKVFVPQDTEVSPGSQQGDQLTDGCVAGVRSESSDELAADVYEDEDDDGFTTVVSKRRVNIQKLPSLVQPGVHKFAFLKPASSFSSLENIHVDSQLPQKTYQPPVTALEGHQHKVDDDKHTNVPHGKLDSLDIFWDEPLDTEPHVRKCAVEWKTGVLSPVMNKPGPGSDVSDLSTDDLHHRVSSPALSMNSGSSSGRADACQAGSQIIGQLTSLRPLKAPSIVLPTRGKNKRLLPSKLYTQQRPASADSSHEGCEEESVSSTTSDRDSMCGDARAPSTDHRESTCGVARAPSTDHRESMCGDARAPSTDHRESTCGDARAPSTDPKDKSSVVTEQFSFCTTSGQDVFSRSAQDSSLHAQYSSSGFQEAFLADSGVRKSSNSNGIATGDPGFNGGIQEWQMMWPGGVATEKLPQASSLGDLQVLVKSDNIVKDRQESNSKETFDNLPTETPGKQEFNLLTGGWGSSGSFRNTSNGCEDIRLPPTDPWQNQDQAIAHFYTDLYREHPELPTMSTITNTCQDKHLLANNSGVFHFSTFSKQFGLIGSGKVKDTDPWFSGSIDSPTSLSTDITFHNHGSQVSPFPAWVNDSTTFSSAEPIFPLPSEPSDKSMKPSTYTTDSSTKPLVYTTDSSTKHLVYTTDSSTKPLVYTTDSSTKPLVYTTDSSTKPSIYTTNSPTKHLVYTTDSSTKPSGANREPLSLTQDSSWAPLLHQSPTRTSTNIEPSESSPLFARETIVQKSTHVKTSDERLTATWGQLDTSGVEARSTQRRTVDTQTSVTGSQIEEMFVSINMLKDSRAQLASALHENMQLQEDVKQERLVRDQVKQDYNRLLTKVHITQASADKWKDDYSQLVKTSQQLNDEVQTQAEIINQLNKQIHMLKTTSLNAQLSTLSMKKELVTNMIDMKQQEAHLHLHRLSNVIAQAKTSDKQLPESVYEKQTEFSEYIATCERLSTQIQVIYLRLAGDLQRGLPVDISQLQVSAPTFPKSPTESSDRPQATSTRLPYADYSNQTQPLTPHSVASLHSSPSRGLSSIHSSPSHNHSSIHSSPSRGSHGRSSIHSSPSRSRSSMHSSPSDSRGTPPPCIISSMHSSPSHSSPSGQTSPPHSIASVHSSPPRGRATIRTSPPDGRDHQKKVWSVLEPEAPPQETEDEDTDAYLRMIYGGSSSKDSLSSRLPPQGKGAPDSKILPTHRLSKLATVEPPIRPHTSHPGQLPYFERIVQTVQEQLPECSRNKIQKIVDTLRRNSGGTLSGWTFESLANQILDMILDLEQEQHLATFGDESAPDEHLSNSFWDSGCSELACSICQCPVEPRQVLTLSCGHQFHEQCVKKWLTSDRSCPNCRSHALLPQDFPVLK